MSMSRVKILLGVGLFGMLGLAFAQQSGVCHQLGPNTFHVPPIGHTDTENLGQSSGWANHDINSNLVETATASNLQGMVWDRDVAETLRANTSTGGGVGDCCHSVDLIGDSDLTLSWSVNNPTAAYYRIELGQPGGGPPPSPPATDPTGQQIYSMWIYAATGCPGGPGAIWGFCRREVAIQIEAFWPPGASLVNVVEGWDRLVCDTTYDSGPGPEEVEFNPIFDTNSDADYSDSYVTDIRVDNTWNYCNSATVVVRNDSCQGVFAPPGGTVSGSVVIDVMEHSVYDSTEPIDNTYSQP